MPVQLLMVCIARSASGRGRSKLEPASGELTYGGIDLKTADPAERARRLAYAGGDTVLVAGSLRQNLLYGCPNPDAAEI